MFMWWNLKFMAVLGVRKVVDVRLGSAVSV
jgi:hypothetical protein